MGRIQHSYDDDQQEVLENVTGSFKQYPMRLAWATHHKSQGQTFEKVIIDMSQGSLHPDNYICIESMHKLRRN